MARGRGSRMSKQWEIIQGAPQILSAGGTSIVGSLAPTEAITVIRMLGEYNIGIGTAAPTALDEAQIGLGICVVSTDAVLAGAASMPDPSDDIGYPWLFWADHFLFFPTNTQTNASRQSSVRRSFDVHSMRKIKPSESLVFVVQYTDVVGTPTIHVGVAATRVLTAH